MHSTIRIWCQIPQADVTIAQLADTIIVREEADIDKIGAVVAKEVIEAALNLT